MTAHLERSHGTIQGATVGYVEGNWDDDVDATPIVVRGTWTLLVSTKHGRKRCTIAARDVVIYNGMAYDYMFADIKVLLTRVTNVLSSSESHTRDKTAVNCLSR